MTTAVPDEGNDPDLVLADSDGDIPGDTLANRLMLARAHAGYLTVKEAAERCGVNYGSWSNWERGALPRDLLDVVQKVATGLRINRNWLLFGGPLLPSRGKPTKRPGSVTLTYPPLASRTSQSSVRPTDNRPNGVGHSRSAISSTRPVSPGARRAVRVG